jgi:vitamin B12 transporter
MIDGVPVTDASGINLSHDLRLLPDQMKVTKTKSSIKHAFYGSEPRQGSILP